MNTFRRSGRTFDVYLSFLRFEHTLFALPFAYAGMVVAARGWPGWGTFWWITLAMVAARTASMALNRVIDARLDALNPRTAQREIPAGLLSSRDGIVLALVGFALLALAGFALNPLTLALLPVAVFFLAIYPYSKRFSWLCHYWLGLTIGAAAAGGWIAVTGAFAPGAIALWVGVGFWIAGFDVIYGLLDLEFDRQHGLFSIPACFGARAARLVAGASHLLALLGFAALLPLASLGVGYAGAVLLVTAVFGYQHWLLWRLEPGYVLRSFNANLVVGAIVLAGIVLEALAGRL